MTYELKDQRVLLTGASSGIGRQLAKELAQRGARLALIARRTNLLEDLAAEITAARAAVPVLIPADLSERGSARAVAERAVVELGGIDTVINNAGSGVGGLQWVVGD